MATTFPTALDNFTNPAGTDNLGSTLVPHSQQHSDLNDAVEAIEAKVGVDGSAVATSHEARIAAFESLGVGSTGWKDMTSFVAGSPGGVSAPSLTNFGPAHTPQRREYAFAVGDYVFLGPYHVNHDIKVGGRGYLHVHWSSSGTNIQPVRWELCVQRALGHNQANFGVPVDYTLTAAPQGTAWRHMITETVDPNYIVFSEPDELLLVTLRRLTNGGTDNTDNIFGIMVDIHYESNRDATPLRVPPFY